MSEYKILFTGSPGAGKTTAIECVSDSAALNTDVANFDESMAKSTTTVGLDYGVLTLDNGDCLRLFGTPGQQRFDFLWKILVKNAMGLVILVDNSSLKPLDDLSIYLTGFAEELATIPCVIGIGRLEKYPNPTLNEYADYLAAAGKLIPIIAVDVRLKTDVVLLIDALLLQIETDSHGANNDD
jgi:uncharacterized protein